MEAVQSKLVIVPKEKRHMGVVVRGMADMGCFVCPGLGMKLFEALEGAGLAFEEQGGYFAGFVVGLEAGEEESVVMKVVDEFLRHLAGKTLSTPWVKSRQVSSMVVVTIIGSKHG